MKKLNAAIILLLALTTESFGQTNNSTVDTYERKVITRPFFVRWIRELFGPEFGQIEKLELKSDGTFHYSHRDRYCGFTNSDGAGTWKKIDNRLTLQPSEESYVPWTNFVLKRRRLYSSLDSLNNGTWAMKKKLS